MLGEPCPKVKLSQDRLPIEQMQMSFAQMSLRANVTQPKIHITVFDSNIKTKIILMQYFLPKICCQKLTAKSIPA
jgi:hypothetical protein